MWRTRKNKKICQILGRWTYLGSWVWILKAPSRREMIEFNIQREVHCHWEALLTAEWYERQYSNQKVQCPWTSAGAKNSSCYKEKSIFLWGDLTLFRGWTQKDSKSLCEMVLKKVKSICQVLDSELKLAPKMKTRMNHLGFDQGLKLQIKPNK